MIASCMVIASCVVIQLTKGKDLVNGALQVRQSPLGCLEVLFRWVAAEPAEVANSKYNVWSC